MARADGPLGFGRPQLWLVLLDPAGRLVPGVITVEDCPPRPDPALVDVMFGRVSALIGGAAPGGSVAVLWARPGDGALRRDDVDWGRDLVRGGRRAGLELWPVHVATDVALRVLTPDDLAA